MFEEALIILIIIYFRKIYDVYEYLKITYRISCLGGKDGSQIQKSTIYTCTGDRGKTGTLSKGRVMKYDRCIKCVGELDELSVLLGYVKLSQVVKTYPLVENINSIQCFLLDIGTFCVSSKSEECISEFDIKNLQNTIDEIDFILPKLTNFLIYSETAEVLNIHLARAQCRKAERTLVKMLSSQLENSTVLNILAYINRLSDFLYVLARLVACVNREKEVKYSKKRMF